MDHPRQVVGHRIVVVRHRPERHQTGHGHEEGKHGRHRKRKRTGAAQNHRESFPGWKRRFVPGRRQQRESRRAAEAPETEHADASQQMERAEKLRPAGDEETQNQRRQQGCLPALGRLGPTAA
jgi:hypothetical protein